MAVDEKRFAELENKVNGTYLMVDAVLAAVTDTAKAPKDNILRRIRDGIARLEAK